MTEFDANEALSARTLVESLGSLATGIVADVHRTALPGRFEVRVSCGAIKYPTVYTYATLSAAQAKARQLTR